MENTSTSLEILTVLGGKGGLTKTTTITSASAGVNEKTRDQKHNAILIDFNPQGDASFIYGANLKNSKTMYHVIKENVPIGEVIQNTNQGAVIVGDDTLTLLEKNFLPSRDIYALKNVLINLVELGYTHVFIDTPALSAGALVSMAIACATRILVPVQAEPLAVKNLVRLLNAVDEIKDSYNPSLEIAGVLLTRYDKRRGSPHAYKNAIQQWCEVNKIKFFNTVIHEGVAIPDAQGNQQSIYEYAKEIPARQRKPINDYLDFIDELLEEG